jgi:hypothetical protein
MTFNNRAVCRVVEQGGCDMKDDMKQTNGQNIPKGMLKGNYPRYWNVHDPAPEEGRRLDFIVRGCHIVTPAQRGKTHYFWMAAFDEDKHLLEKLQASVAADPRGLDFLEVTLGADGAGIKVRQSLNKKLKAEGRTPMRD